MSNETQNKILKEAIKAFNQYGYSAVSLHQLAKQVGISRGNLTYYFKDKDQLLETIGKQMWSKIKAERNKSRQFPSFENLHNEVQLLYKFQKEYAFIFLDTHVLNHPYIKKQFRQMTNRIISDNKETIAFSIKIGNLKPESIQGMYHNVAFVTWMLAFYWLSQQIIRGEKTSEDGEKTIWSILLPHFTIKGIESFKNFFGEDYYHSLGKPFDVDAENLITF